MSCIEFDFSVPNDKGNKLRNIVESVAGTDAVKATVLASYFTSSDFLDYVKENTGKDNMLDVNGNTMRKLLRNFFEAKHIMIENSINKRTLGALDGFSSAKAKSIAKDHTANIIIDTYYEEASKPKAERLKRKDIINKTTNEIVNNFINSYATPLFKGLKETNTTEFNSLRENINNILTERNKIVKEHNRISEEVISNPENIELVEQLNKLKDDIQNLDNAKFLFFANVVDSFGNDRQKNYKALAMKAKGDPNNWFNQTFTISKLANIAREFTEILEHEKFDAPISFDEVDVTNIDSDGINEESKRWADDIGGYKDFSQHISADMKLYFSTLYRLSEPNFTGKDYAFDTNNELGVPMTLGANYVIVQISNYASFYSVDDFINSVERAAKNIESLYGLSKLVNDMRANREFANKVFHQLANPKIKKAMISIEANGIQIDQSNKSVEPITSMLYDLMNVAKSTITENFSIEDSFAISKILTDIQRAKDDTVFRNSNRIKTADEFIINTLTKYFPQLDSNNIRSYLYGDTNGIIQRYRDILSDISNFINNAEKVIDQQNKTYASYSKDYAIWKQKQEAFLKAEVIYTETMPVYDNSSINYDAMLPALIELSKKLVNYNAIKNELNSVNAEGNLGSDLIGNNFITNTIKQIHYGTEENANQGLQNLLDFISKSKQYDYSPIFYGIRDNKGKVLIPGLFEKQVSGKTTINPNAKDIINVFLFSGATDRNNAKSALYANMSKGDYFLSQIIAFNQPVYSPDSQYRKEDLTRHRAGYFMRTPSDAPKNFIVQAPVAHIWGMWDNDKASENNYINKTISDLSNKYNITSNETDIISEVLLGADRVTRNKLNAEELYDIISELPTTKNYNRLYSKEDKDGVVRIPLIYEAGEERVVVVLKGNKVLGTINNIINDVEVETFYTNSINKDGKSSLPLDFTIDIRQKLISNGILDGSIIRNVNKQHPLFRGFYSNVYGELVNFIENLNNVFEYNKGEFSIKKDGVGLIDRYHYNGEIVKDGKLTGNVFNFVRLFETMGYNTNSELDNGLFLYGQDITDQKQPLIAITKNNKVTLNTNRNDLIIINNGKIELNIDNANIELLESIVENWVINFSKEINNRTKQYETIIDERFTNEQVQDAIFNAALMEMNFDDLFEGDSKFYKNAQDFLKRAKEVQASGKAHAGFDMQRGIGEHLQNVLNNDGSEIDLLVNDKQYMTPIKGVSSITEQPLRARDGFRGITIHNTVRISENADNMYKELKDILSKDMSEDKAKQIAESIATGYGYKDGAKTITNDAQSYITIEEFIRRKYADGTLSEYMPLINQLMDDTPLSDLNLKGINARIQVQKNFYFDKQFDKDTNTYYPRQIKNAEIVLIPKLIKGTSLEKLYNIMKAHDIGQVNTVEASKAAKRDILTFWDNEGKVTEESEKSFIDALSNDVSVETYYYRYLYKQQEVSEHMKDERNRAGIQIMKKVMDNASTASPAVRTHIDNLFKSYVANIKEDYNTLIERMGWKVNEDGSFSNKNNDSDLLDFTEFYKRAREEAQRLGMDSNFVEYLTPDVLGQPVMPNYMNNVSTKLESIAQAIFNSSITRQKLPGWHAAQITNVGYDTNLKYHPQIVGENGEVIQEAYAEVKIPRWSNLIPKDYSLEELAAAGLDLHIGYRIPTEGKQSVSILKVVGFLDDSQGSTIVVPDEWVAQTGSDFDVDSVYGISYEMYRDRNGIIQKVQFDTDVSENAIKGRYIRYVNSNLDERVDNDRLSDEFIRDNIADLRNSIRDAKNRKDDSPQFNELMQEEHSIYQTLPKDKQLEIRQFNVTNRNIELGDKLNAIANIFEVHAMNEQDVELKTKYEEFSDINRAISDLINLNKERNNDDIIELKSKIKDKVNELYKQAKEDYFNKVQDVAKKADILSFEEFSNLLIEEQNTRKARNNRVLDSMIGIMQDDTSREENYSRSNFDDLADAKDIVDALRTKQELLDGDTRSSVRSAYNPLDQIDFMENAVSGMQLKAFSVTRDTFNSINNYMQSRLSKENSIVVEYDANKYDLETIKDAYGNNVVYNEKTKTIKVRHDRFANSKNNRNVIGKLITPYSSQTTAHILDAVKKGAIFNENDYTFGTFKTLIDLGIDYDTAIMFLQQPAITRIVESYFETKSIYVNAGGNPVEIAIKRIANDLGLVIGGEPITDYTPIKYVNDILSNNKSVKQAFKQLFGAEIDLNNIANDSIFTINSKLLENRFNYAKNYNNFTEEQKDNKYVIAAFDIATALTFNKIYKTTRNIEAIARVSNPDRFGAKQTIRATRQTRDNIIKYITDVESPVHKTLNVGDDTFLEALYPGIETNELDISKSGYPYLAAFLKYSTIPSIDINSRLFSIESSEYNDVVDYVQNKLGITFTDEQYREYKQYMISELYSGIPMLMSPLTTNEYGWFVVDNEKAISNQEQDTDYWSVERSRIFGYDSTKSVNIKVEDINNPTTEEITKFNNLTPAQKVIWIQSNFVNDKGVFDFLKVNMFNQYEYKSKGFTSQSIRYSDQVDDIEQIYVAFRDSFFNKNPLVRLAALDLVKYAFIVEGFKFKKGSISKIITNDSLIANVENKGIDIIGAIKKNFALYNNVSNQATQRFIDKFIRSHSEIVKEYNIPRARKNKTGVENIGSKFNKYIQTKGMAYIPFEEGSKDILDFLNIDPEYPKDYIRLTRYVNDGKTKDTTLYKMVYGEKGLYLYPLNILERNETSQYSTNYANNKFKTEKFYEQLIHESIDNGVTINDIAKSERYSSFVKDINAEYSIPRYKSERITESLENKEELIRLVDNGSRLEKANANNFIKDVTDYYTLPVEEQGKYAVIKNDSFSISNMFPKGLVAEQIIPFGESNRLVRISKHKASKNFNYLLKGDKRGDVAKLTNEERFAYNQSVESKAVKPTLYKVEIVTNEEVEQNIKNIQKSIEEARGTNDEMYAITDIIEDLDIENNLEYTSIDAVAKDMFNELYKRNRLEQDRYTERFIRTMDIHGVDRFSAKSLHNNRNNVLKAAASYYANKSQILLSEIDGFSTITGEKISIDSPELYEHLRKFPEDYHVLTKLILDAKTFGDQFYDIMNLNLRGEDTETTAAINKIRNAINSVRNNSKLQKGMELMFNDYIANTYSTNPLVRHGIIDLRTQFGDTNWFDSHFSDIGELNNKQVQTVVKYVNGIINEATQLDAPIAVNEFTKRFDEIMASVGAFNWDNVVTKEGKFITPYTDKFLEDRQSHIDAVKDAEQQYGVDSLEYIKAKLARDKFRAKNIEQPVVQEYYNRNNAIIENILKQSPNTYVEYMKLIHELYSDNSSSILTIKEEKLRRKEINRKISALTNEYDINGNLKTEQELINAANLKRFIKNKRDLNQEYFKFDEADGFRDTLEYNLRVLSEYEKKHPFDDLSIKLNNDTYREAYEWIQANTTYELNEDARQKIIDAFKALKDNSNPKSGVIGKIIDAANAYDEIGNIDARKLSKEDLEKIKNLTAHKYSWNYESNAGEAVLIKEVPAGLPVLKDSFYRSLRDPSENAQGVNPLRLQTIGRINELIGKVVDGNNGEIRTKDLFDTLSEEELQELANLYKALGRIKGERKSKELRKKFKDSVEFKTNDFAFNREWAYAQQHLKGTNKYNLWLDIFVQSDKNGEFVTNEDNSFVPNNDIYGYIEPKDKSQIDEQKTNARKIIEDNVEFVPNEYYYLAMRDATNKGLFEQWYKDNHVYNPYSHKLEPLQVWTKMEVNPKGSLNATYDYVPTYENTERTVKEEYENKNYKSYSTNYNQNTGDYNNHDKLTTKEHDMLTFLQGIITNASTTYSMKKFAERGFLPRRAKYPTDGRWFAKQVIGAAGLEFRNSGEKQWTDKVDYATDREVEFEMLQLIKRKGYKDRLPIPAQGTYETTEEYQIRVDDIRKQNKEIDAENLKLDNEVLDRDWRSVFQDFINKSAEHNAKQKVKNTIYLLLEDLKSNPAYQIGRYSGKLKRDGSKSTNESVTYQKEDMKNTVDLVENWARRIIRKEFKKDSKMSDFAGLMQNITSAKYMIFNVTGGIANITTGWTNMLGEVFAKDYFDSKTINAAQGRYFSNMLSFMADMYNPTSSNLTVALTKMFDVVDFDNITERRPNEKASTYVRRWRDGLFGLQTGGEHYMQNTVMFAMLKSHRIFKDTDGALRAGTLGEYNWEVEIQTLMRLLENKEDMLQQYKVFIRDIKNDLDEVRKYDLFTRDFNQEFLKSVGDKQLIKDYIAARKVALKQAEIEFAKNPLVEDQFELQNGIAVIKPDSQLTGQMFGELRQKVISVNKKIHGVYDKIGAAKIEREWWGSLVMQYHKHIYPGIMKRYRTRGYYNEVRSSIEKGSYISLFNLLSTEFDGVIKKSKEQALTDNENVALKSLQNIAKASIDTVLNIKLNYQMMPVWEQNNLKRSLADMLSVVSAVMFAIAIHVITDEDELKDSNTLSTMLYLADRLASESQMYTPWGLYGEGKTLWSSPIAAINGPGDLLKGTAIVAQMMFDPNFESTYKTGLYKGEHKLEMVIRRNIPLLRVIDRLDNMAKNNQYYRLNENALNFIPVKAIANEIKPD